MNRNDPAPRTRNAEDRGGRVRLAYHFAGGTLSNFVGLPECVILVLVGKMLVIFQRILPT